MNVRSLTTYEFWKGIGDRLLALLTMLAISPLLVIIGIAIMLDSRGNPLFSQDRIGKDGRRFTLHKFRSMHVNHDDSKYEAFIQKYVQEAASSRLDENGEDLYDLVKDPRVTRVGALLRKTNLDELPQLWNILKGDMSFVGPRPDIPFAVNMYQSRHMKRFSVSPGITCLWQVSGRKSLSFEDMVRLDLDYIKRQSPLLDAKIMLRTVGTILRGDGS